MNSIKMEDLIERILMTHILCGIEITDGVVSLLLLGGFVSITFKMTKK